jgi:hypothetical protein
MIKLKDILLSEKAVSKQQQKFFGVVKAMQKGDIPKKGEAGKIAKDMPKKDVDDFAGTKHKGLPDKVDEESLDEKGTRCWKGYKKKGMKTMFGKRVPNCVKNEAELEKEKFTTPDQMRMYEDEVEENLRQWFGKGGKGSASGGGWDRYNTKGEKIGKCGDRKKGEGTPKCLSKDDASTMSKKQRAAAVRKKRREDPNPNRRGKAKNVSSKTKKRSKKESVLGETNIEEKKDACYHKVKGRYKKWPSAYGSGALVQCRKKGAANWGTGGKKK